MKKINRTLNKIKADENLKSQIQQRVCSQPLETYYRHEIKQQKQKPLFHWSKVVAAVVAFVLVLSVPLTVILLSGNVESPLTPTNAQRNKIIEFLSKQPNSGVEYGHGDLVAEDAPPPTNSADEDRDFATTNNQQEGVDEGDIIKVDNNFIYTLTAAGLTIVDISKSSMQISCQISYENFFPDELFIFGDKIVVIGGVYSQLEFLQPEVEGSAIDDCIEPYIGWRNSTSIIVYDMGDRANLTKLAEYEISGWFVTSRLIENRLIVAVNHNVYRNQPETYFPKINGEEVPTDEIFLYDTTSYNYCYNYSYTILAALNLDSLQFASKAHLGLYGTMYFSNENVYFFASIYQTTMYAALNWGYSYKTMVAKIALDSLEFCASARIDGLVNDRYWADEHNGNLRVVTAHYSYKRFNGGGQIERYSKVYVLDESLKTLGTITGIAPDETIYSVRFRGDEGTIVTFLQVDPLFKLDLSDPKNPKISDGLKEEGVNNYLQYLSDDIILGLGQNANWGMKIAIYDNRGEDAVNLKTIYIGSGYAYSEALWNPKAILNDTAKNMFSFAVTMQGSSYNALLEQGLAVFEYNLDAESSNDKLIYRGLLSNLESNKVYENWQDYCLDYFAYVKRGARIGSKIFTISDRYIASYDIDTLQLIERIEIADFSHYFD